MRALSVSKSYERGSYALYLVLFESALSQVVILGFPRAVFFVIVNLGLPTILARMIDEGVNSGRNINCMFGRHHARDYPMWNLGRIVLSYAASKLTTNMVKDMRDDLYAKLQEYSHHEYEKIGVSSLGYSHYQ